MNNSIEIIAHRGLWGSNVSPNSVEAFAEACRLGFGVEIDVRDRLGDIVVSHDMSEQDSLKFEDFLDCYCNNVKLALNIKADGLVQPLFDLIGSREIKNYFAFDMSIPEMAKYSKARFNYYSHVSDICRTPPAIDAASGLWIDCFNRLWYSKDTIVSLSKNFRSICIVSEELHGRDYAGQWRLLRDVLNQEKGINICLCTDHPVIARDFFKND